ncbi:tRNA (adenosine(37)-N6)-dimethylallyltransferase MiaA [Mesorhizobium microcysteis]|uniref:tRNA dimethylallyltransferase n=1 Tax=Neoaquamicrobium microcysteis TaxID=2682781 RepID=A0A5D4GWV4_9HYPH|nr:tRNA (adenosine(37)-N6)-dimethylallyltransferase MiaA [Mesorhizobium microcysteis]TYR32868.1 tRNA (adenosine(37)-N6)-dimethylallyltransferase MiaA [Mesorhizobium microcysteis]
MDVSGDAGSGGPLKNAILIAGPTASGKSALALRHARETGGTVVNADSMQVYSVLRALTARPDDQDLATAPHRLYGHVDPREPYSTGRWMREVADLIRAGAFADAPAIFVGGTGLYFRALLEGLSRMPDVPADIREKWRSSLVCEGPAALHAKLAASDSEAAAAIRPSDGQRIVRALEVLDASGKPISHWQKAAGEPLVDRGSARLLVIEPDRKLLADRIGLRFDRMLDAGALDEARALARLGVGAEMPAMKAIGVRELLATDRGELSLDAAMDLAKTATRQYAKRQSTWFRNQLGSGWQRIAME